MPPKMRKRWIKQSADALKAPLARRSADGPGPGHGGGEEGREGNDERLLSPLGAIGNEMDVDEDVDVGGEAGPGEGKGSGGGGGGGMQYASTSMALDEPGVGTFAHIYPLF